MKYTIDEIEQKIYEVMKIYNISRMPTSKEVRISKIPGLESSIDSTGGYVKWAEKLNLSPKKPITKHNDESIKQSILHTMQQLNIDRMPSRSEILSIENNASLHNAIVRSYGYYKWAERLNLEIKDSETLFGTQYQEICLEYLSKLGYVVEDTSTKAPYDLLINNNVRVDVKSGCAYNMRGSRVHSFGINKKFPTCDLYIIYALNENTDNIERIFVIPSKDFKLVSLCIGANSKYNKYINKWNLIDIYIEFYNKLIV